MYVFGVSAFVNTFHKQTQKTEDFLFNVKHFWTHQAEKIPEGLSNMHDYIQN